MSKLHNVCLLSVGDDYGNNIPARLYNNRNVFILTDTPSKFNQAICSTYSKPIFNYFDKLHFAIDTVLATEEPVFLVDDDATTSVFEYDNVNLSQHNSVLFEHMWGEEDTNLELMSDGSINWYWLNKLFKFKGYDTSKIYPIFEQLIYFPYNENLIHIKSFLNEVEDFFHIISIISNDYIQKGICNAEGLALSYALYRAGIDLKKFKNVC